MNLLVYAVPVLLLGSVVLFVKAAFVDRRPQKVGLVWALLALPLYVLYYNDKWPVRDLPMRDVVRPLTTFGGDSNFRSALTPAALVGGLYLIRMTVFQRIAVRRRLQRVNDPIANFFAGVAAAILIGAVIVSMFSLGWVGALVVAGIFTLVYLGALAVLAAVAEVTIQTSKLISVWARRKLFSVATRITRTASWISSLSGKLVPRSWVDRIRLWTTKQESIYLTEQELQDQQLVEAFERDHERREHGHHQGH